MDLKLKQRLTGAIVLVALAVIFVPIILEGPDDEWTPRSHSIPEQPQMDYRASMELELPESESAPEPEPESETVGQAPPEGVITEALELREQRPPAATPAATASNAAPTTRPSEPVASPPKPASETPPAPARKAENTTKATLKGWFVQVGSFGQEMNASGLRDRLKTAGYDARLQKVAIGKGYAYRVLVGPSTSRAVAEKLAGSLKAGQQLSGIVIEYP
jgi:DedD protein